MASSGDDLEEDMHGGQDGPGSKKAGKKFLQPFRKMRRFFSSRRRAKSREDDPEGEGTPPAGVAVKSKSTTDVLRAGQSQEDTDDDESSQVVGNKTLSMSADSVFTPDPRTIKDTNLDGLKSSARSMEHLGQPAFTNELFQKLKSRRNEDDDGLPSSPVTDSTTRDVLNDFKKPIDKRHASKNSVDSSMYSSEDELEEKNVFEQDWTTVVSASRQNISGMSDSTENLDLNVVTSTTSLVTEAARHKIAIKPKNVRPSTQHRRQARSPAPKALPLPQLEEKAETKADDSDARSSKGSLKVDAKADRKQSPKVEVRRRLASGSDQDERLSGSRSDDSLDDNLKVTEIKVTADVESPDERKRPSDSSKDEDDSDNEEDIEEESKEESPRPESPPPVTMIVIPKAEPKAGPPPLSPKPMKREAERKRTVSETKEEKVEVKEAEKKEAEEKEKTPPPAVGAASTPDADGEAKPFNVVLRKTGRRSNIEEKGTIRMRDTAGDRDPSKRQTIAGDAGLTTIFGDRKSGQRNSFIEASRSPEGNEESPNEFSKVLNRLKKQPSRKKLIPGEDESGKKVERKTSVEKSVVVESKPKVVAEAKTVVVESSKPKVAGGPQKMAESKPKLPENKPKISESKPKISENKPKISENKPKIAETKPKLEIKPKIAESKPVIVSPKSSDAKTEDSKAKETVVISKVQETPKPKEKEKVVIVKREESLKVSKEPETKVKTPSPVVTPSSSKPDPSPETKKPIIVETTKPTTTPTPTPTKPEPTKSIVIEKAKSAETPKKVVTIQKSDPPQQPPQPKTPPAKDPEDAKASSFKRDTPAAKNRTRSQTLTDAPVSAAAPPGANKENEKTVQRSHSHPHGDGTEERTPTPKPTTEKAPTDSAPTTPPAATPGGKPAGPGGPGGRPRGPPGSEPAWFTLARRKTANWDQKEKDLEQKEKKETSNQAEKERDASSMKGKEVGLTIDEAAKEESKPALRNTVKCSNSAANRQSKVLDMAKLFQNQVS